MRREQDLEAALRVVADHVPPTASTCACGHDFAEHDTVAVRYCRATITSVVERDCICQAVPRIGGTLGLGRIA